KGNQNEKTSETPCHVRHTASVARSAGRGAADDTAIASPGTDSACVITTADRADAKHGQNGDQQQSRRRDMPDDDAEGNGDDALQNRRRGRIWGDFIY